MTIVYDDLVAAVAPTGMVVRGGFHASAAKLHAGLPPMPLLDDGRPTRSVVIVGNAGGAMWGPFSDGRSDGPNPLDRWTRDTLRPIAAEFDATFLHPSDEPYQPFQRWAQLADDVWSSPIGLLVHSTFGLWHAYRGAFLTPVEVTDLPPVGRETSPCVTCVGQPCLTTCPVDAFGPSGYDGAACAGHVRSDASPNCLDDGCAARGACPVGVTWRYESEQMRFHMRAFIGD